MQNKRLEGEAGIAPTIKTADNGRFYRPLFGGFGQLSGKLIAKYVCIVKINLSALKIGMTRDWGGIKAAWGFKDKHATPAELKD